MGDGAMAAWAPVPTPDEQGEITLVVSSVATTLERLCGTASEKKDNTMEHDVIEAVRKQLASHLTDYLSRFADAQFRSAQMFCSQWVSTLFAEHHAQFDEATFTILRDISNGRYIGLALPEEMTTRLGELKLERRVDEWSEMQTKLLEQRAQTRKMLLEPFHDTSLSLCTALLTRKSILDDDLTFRFAQLVLERVIVRSLLAARYREKLSLRGRLSSQIEAAQAAAEVGMETEPSANAAAASAELVAVRGAALLANGRSDALSHLLDAIPSQLLEEGQAAVSLQDAIAKFVQGALMMGRPAEWPEEEATLALEVGRHIVPLLDSQELAKVIETPEHAFTYLGAAGAAGAALARHAIAAAVKRYLSQLDELGEHHASLQIQSAAMPRERMPPMIVRHLLRELSDDDVIECVRHPSALSSTVSRFLKLVVGGADTEASIRHDASGRGGGEMTAVDRKLSREMLELLVLSSATVMLQPGPEEAGYLPDLLRRLLSTPDISSRLVHLSVGCGDALAADLVGAEMCRRWAMLLVQSAPPAAQLCPLLACCARVAMGHLGVSSAAAAKCVASVPWEDVAACALEVVATSPPGKEVQSDAIYGALRRRLSASALEAATAELHATVLPPLRLRLSTAVHAQLMEWVARAPHVDSTSDSTVEALAMEPAAAPPAPPAQSGVVGLLEATSEPLAELATRLSEELLAEIVSSGTLPQTHDLSRRCLAAGGRLLSGGLVSGVSRAALDALRRAMSALLVGTLVRHGAEADDASSLVRILEELGAEMLAIQLARLHEPSQLASQVLVLAQQGTDEERKQLLLRCAMALVAHWATARLEQRGFDRRVGWVMREALADYSAGRLVEALRDPEALLLSLLQDAASASPFVQELADDTLASIKEAAVNRLLEAGLPATFAVSLIDSAQDALANPSDTLKGGLDAAKEFKPAEVLTLLKEEIRSASATAGLAFAGYFLRRRFLPLFDIVSDVLVAMQICASDAGLSEGASAATIGELLEFRCVGRTESSTERVFFALVATFFVLTWIILWVTLLQYALSHTLEQRAGGPRNPDIFVRPVIALTIWKAASWVPPSDSPAARSGRPKRRLRMGGLFFALGWLRNILVACIVAVLALLVELPAFLATGLVMMSCITVRRGPGPDQRTTSALVATKVLSYRILVFVVSVATLPLGVLLLLSVEVLNVLLSPGGPVRDPFFSSYENLRHVLEPVCESAPQAVTQLVYIGYKYATTPDAHFDYLVLASCVASIAQLYATYHYVTDLATVYRVRPTAIITELLSIGSRKYVPYRLVLRQWRAVDYRLVGGEGSLSLDHVRQIGAALASNSTLTCLRFGKSQLGTEGLEALCPALQGSKALRELSIYADPDSEDAYAQAAASAITPADQEPLSAKNVQRCARSRLPARPSAEPAKWMARQPQPFASARANPNLQA